MPCDSLAEAKIDLGKVDRKILASAMTALGFSDWRITNNGQLTIRGASASESLVASVKQTYAKQVVVAQARRFGWKLTEQPDGKLLVQKARM